MEHLRCAYCQEIIGAYEPARVLLRDGSELNDSRTVREQLETHGSLALHTGCFDQFLHGDEQGGGAAAG